MLRALSNSRAFPSPLTDGYIRQVWAIGPLKRPASVLSAQAIVLTDLRNFISPADTSMAGHSRLITTPPVTIRLLRRSVQSLAIMTVLQSDLLASHPVALSRRRGGRFRSGSGSAPE